MSASAMTKSELEAKLAALQATLPPAVRETVDLKRIERLHRQQTKTLKGARGGKPTKAAAQRQQKAFASYKDNPTLQIVNTLLHQLLATANTALPKAFRNVPVKIFGKADNRLDPLDFNGKAGASAGGEVCWPPKSCTNLWILGEVCSPSICANGRASAGLDVLRGLSNVQVAKLAVASVGAEANGIVTISADLEVLIPGLNASGHARAEAGLAGINIPVGMSASAHVWWVTVRSRTKITIDLRKPAITKLELTTFDLERGTTYVIVQGLGIFGFALAPLTAGLDQFIKRFFSKEGDISNALRSVLQSQLNSLVG